MELVEVESSNVRAIGYDPATNVLRIKFLNGHVYDYDNITPEFHAALMAAPSKGKFVARHLLMGTIRTMEAQKEALEKLKSVPASAGATSLSTFEQDQCCGGPLARALREGRLDDAEVWACPKCGCTWKATLFPGKLKHWSPVPLIEVLRV